MESGIDVKPKARVAILASGRGSNAKAIIDYAQNDDCNFEVVLVMSNKKTAGVLQLAQSQGIKNRYFSRKEFYENNDLVEYLFDNDIDLIALAGFLWLVPHHLIEAYPNLILNIHPSLLPKYGGKGMFGHHVHQAVKANADEESGMTIHMVNEVYDEGKIVLQAHCQIMPHDSADQIAKRVLRLEHHFYPRVIEGVVSKF